jgi:Protein of unknown function (DUF4231)
MDVKKLGASTEYQASPDYRYTKNYNQKPTIDWEDSDPPYVKNRLGPFILFLDNERVKVRNIEQCLQYILIIAGTLVPIVNVTGIPTPISTIFSAILGGIVVVCAGLLQFEKYHERWLSFKMITTKLSNEYYFWKNKVGEYGPKDTNPNKQMTKSNEEGLTILVSRCENIILSEAIEYIGFFSRPNKSDTDTT